MQNITQTLFFKAILLWEVTNLHEKNMWPHQGCHQGLGAGISPGYYEHDPSYFHVGNKKKMEPKELPSQSIHRLLTAYTGQLEIFVTALLMIILREIHVFNYNSLIGSHVETSKRSKTKTKVTR